MEASNNCNNGDKNEEIDDYMSNEFLNQMQVHIVFANITVY